MGYVTIANKLVELVTAVSGFSSGRVYGYDPNLLGGYPAATITAIGHKNRFNDTASNIRQYQFLIRLWYRTKDDQNAEAILRDLTDKVLEKLEANVVVPGIWDKAVPTEAVWRTGEREGPILTSEITVMIEQRVNRNV